MHCLFYLINLEPLPFFRAVSSGLPEEIAVMGKKKKPTVLKKSVSESTSLAADTANLSSASPTPGPPTPTPESHPSTSAPIEPPQPEPVTNSGGVETNGTDQPQDLKTHADALKEQGNDFFKNKHYEKAVGLYTEAISESGY